MSANANTRWGVVLLGSIALAVLAFLARQGQRRGSDSLRREASAVEGPTARAPMVPTIDEPRLAARQPAESSGAAPLMEPERAVESTEDDAQALGEGPDDWERRYADATLGQIIDARRALQQALDEETEPYYQRAWESGNFQVRVVEKTEEGGYPMPDEIIGGGDLTSSRMDVSIGEVRWVTLPREGFEKQYETGDEIRWLVQREQVLRRTPLPPRSR